jgi:hypothetical protein
MAMPQRDDTIEAIKRLGSPSRVRYGGPGALLEYAVMHDDEEETECIRAELTKLVEGEGVARQGLRNVDCVELTRWARRGG